MNYLTSPSNKRRPQIVAAAYCRVKKLVAAASDRGNTVHRKVNHWNITGTSVFFL